MSVPGNELLSQEGNMRTAGLPGGSVYDAMTNPPTSGVAAQTAVRNVAIATGHDGSPSVDYPSLAYSNGDFIKSAWEATRFHEVEDE